MVLLGDEAQVESRVSQFGDIVSDVQDRSMLRRTYHWLGNRFGRT
jgi:hypothetical protein